MSGCKISASSCAPESGWFPLQTPVTRRSTDVSAEQACGLNQHGKTGIKCLKRTISKPYSGQDLTAYWEINPTIKTWIRF